MNRQFIAKVNCSKVGENFKLATYGRLEIGNVPKAAFVIKLIPKELITNPKVTKAYYFSNRVFTI